LLRALYARRLIKVNTRVHLCPLKHFCAAGLGFLACVYEDARQTEEREQVKNGEEVAHNEKHKHYVVIGLSLIHLSAVVPI